MATLELATKRFPKVLKQMQFDALRPGQSEVVWNVIRGYDTLCILPTSGGKSATYQVPTLCVEGKTLIFSPLVALMKDQMESMLRKGLRADQISSGQTPRENSNALSRWQSGQIDFLLVAPERIANDEFLRTMLRHPPTLIVADEVHCVSQWADSFRPQYRILGEFISQVNPPTVLALTATCTPEIERDIREYLYLQDATKIVNYPPRENLEYISYEGKTLEDAFDAALESKLLDGKEPTVIYCGTVKNVEAIYQELKMRIPSKVLMYHGQMKPEQRNHCQSMFMRDECTVMVATNAFGMGVDKPNIRRVIHLDAPGNIEAYAQEAGRGGRDGKPSKCILYFTQKAYQLQQWFIDNKYPAFRFLEQVYKQLQEFETADGNVMITGAECAQKTDMHPMQVDACMNLLISNSIIERITPKDRFAKIKFLTEPSDKTSKNLKKYWDLLNTVSFPDNKGYYEIGLNFLADELKVLPASINAQIKKLEASSEILYEPPFRGKPIKILQPLSAFDKDFLVNRRSQLHLKLKQMKDYARTPDDKKQDFLQDYFLQLNGVKNG